MTAQDQNSTLGGTPGTGTREARAGLSGLVLSLRKGLWALTARPHSQFPAIPTLFRLPESRC